MEAFDEALDLGLEASLAELGNGVPLDSPELLDDDWPDHHSGDERFGQGSEAGCSEAPRSSASVTGSTVPRPVDSLEIPSVKDMSEEWQSLFRDKLTSVVRSSFDAMGKRFCCHGFRHYPCCPSSED